MSPIVVPATATVVSPTRWPCGPFSKSEIDPPGAKPAVSEAESPVVTIAFPLASKRSLRPKNCEKATPPRKVGLFASSEMTRPLPPVALNCRTPSLKVAVPFPPSAVLSAVTKLPTLAPVAIAGPPSSESVPPVKSIATLCCSAPDESTMPIVVEPEKLSASVPSSPVCRPSNSEGGGTVAFALCWALKARESVWASWPNSSPMPSSVWSRTSRRPRSLPDVACGSKVAICPMAWPVRPFTVWIVTGLKLGPALGE